MLFISVRREPNEQSGNGQSDLLDVIAVKAQPKRTDKEMDILIKEVQKFLSDSVTPVCQRTNNQKSLDLISDSLRWLAELGLS